VADYLDERDEVLLTDRVGHVRPNGVLVSRSMDKSGLMTKVLGRRHLGVSPWSVQGRQLLLEQKVQANGVKAGRQEAQSPADYDTSSKRHSS
jgi:hypothetical protein